MKDAIFKYDELSDTMYISFADGKKGTGIELNEQILLRVDESEKRAVGLTLFDYSVFAQPTEMGFRNLRLNGIEKLPNDVREMVLEILQTSPVSEILSLSAYTPSTVETIPITSLRNSVLNRKAA